MDILFCPQGKLTIGPPTFGRILSNFPSYITIEYVQDGPWRQQLLYGMVGFVVVVYTLLQAAQNNKVNHAKSNFIFGVKISFCCEESSAR